MSGPNKNNSHFSSVEAAVDNENITTFDSLFSSTFKDKELLYEYSEIDGKRWNKQFPYQLLIIEKTKDGYRDIGKSFTLPIPPQSIEIDMPFAINVSATLGGIVEEHNGTPFRLIALTGTTGILPLKGAPDSLPSSSAAQSVFAGTSSALTGAVNQTNRAKAMFDGQGTDSLLNVVPESEFDSIVASHKINRTTGYYQFHLLKSFLEAYGEIKKKAENRKYRLALAIWKDKSVFLVTPMSLRSSKDGSSPHEYRFALQFKAWGRINLDEPSFSKVYSPLGRDPGAFAKVINKIEQARGVLSNGKKILEAARGDIEKALFTPLREVSLALKDAAAVVITAADLPANIVKDFKKGVIELANISTVPGAIGSAFSNLPKDLEREFQSFSENASKLSVSTSKGETGAGNLLHGPSTRNLPDRFNTGNPISKIFDNSNDFFGIMSKISPTNIKLDPQVQRKIRDEISRVKTFTRKDFEQKRDQVAGVMIDFAQSVGQGSETFNRTFGIVPRINANVREATDLDFEILFNLNQALLELNRLCVSDNIDPAKLDAIDFIGGLARKSGIAFTRPVSKFLAPMLYGHTLEEVSKQYLGTPDRWHEIAALNGLREPYVDEVGFDRLLLTNGVTNQIQISDASNLYVGQAVYISSLTVARENRRITGIQQISDTIFIVTLSGDADLDKFTLAAHSGIHAYLPDTVNSQMSIYIPSQDQINEEDFKTKQIPGINYFDSLVRVGGISILLGPTNDIVLTPYGSSKYVYGLNNIIQKTKIALSTPKGALLHHPDYGLPVQPGLSTADVNAKDILQSIKAMFRKDKSFSSVNSVLVVKNGPTTKITANFAVAGVSQNVPVTVEIKR